MKRIRVGLIGAGGMAAYHIPGFRKAGAEMIKREEMAVSLQGTKEGATLMKIVDAIYKSSRTGRPIRV